MHSLAQAIEELTTVKNLLSQSFGHINDAGIDLAEIKDEDGLKKLDKSARDMVDTVVELGNIEECISTIKRELQAGSWSNDPGDRFEKRLREKNAALKPSVERYITNVHYKDFRQKIWEVNHPDQQMPQSHLISNIPENLLRTLSDINVSSQDEDDIQMTKSATSLICPLTATPLVDPYENLICKHNYSKEAIFSYICSSSKRTGNGDAICPITGCQAIVKRSHLQPNKVLERRLLNMQAIEDVRNSSEYLNI